MTELDSLANHWRALSDAFYKKPIPIRRKRRRRKPPLRGALGGAMSMAAYGPYAALAGAVVGGAAGIFGDHSDYRGSL